MDRFIPVGGLGPGVGEGDGNTHIVTMGSLQAVIARLIVELEKSDGQYDTLVQESRKLTAERDQALAQAATAAMEMRERAAEHAWNKRDLLADAEKKQIDAGLTGRDYYGRRLEAELLSRSIRALPIVPDAQKALDKMLARVREDAIREAAAVSGHYMSDEGDELLLSMWREDILALLNDGGSHDTD